MSIAMNEIKTVAFLGLLTALLLWAGNFFGHRGLTAAVIFVALMNIGVYFYSDKIVLKMHRAVPLKKKDNEELWNIVRKVAKSAGIPMPKIFLINSDTPNAFATGRNPKHSAVAVTKGILRLLDKKELEGVIAHEIAHIKNRDTLIATIAATIAGIIGYIAMIARWTAVFGMGGRDREGSSLAELLVLVIIMPLIATLIRLAISRSREFIADEKGARFVNNPLALASALEKLEYGVQLKPMKNGRESTASLFIVNPFSAQNVMRLFSTHPPTKERVKRLKAMKF